MAQPLTTRVISTLEFSGERAKDSKFHMIYLSEYQGRQLPLLGLHSSYIIQPVTVILDVKLYPAQCFTMGGGCMVFPWYAISFGAQESTLMQLSLVFYRSKIVFSLQISPSSAYLGQYHGYEVIIAHYVLKPVFFFQEKVPIYGLSNCAFHP